jgi:hypothetical protein
LIQFDLLHQLRLQRRLTVLVRYLPSYLTQVGKSATARRCNSKSRHCSYRASSSLLCDFGLCTTLHCSSHPLIIHAAVQKKENKIQGMGGMRGEHPNSSPFYKTIICLRNILLANIALTEVKVQ